MNTIRNLIQLCLLGVILLALPYAMNAQFTFTTYNGAITITGYTGSGGLVTIPDTINGLPVTGIGQYAFENNANITSITIGTNITSIGGGAFVNCSDLGSIIVNANNQSYSSLAGVLFNRSQTTLIAFPGGSNATSYAIPNSATNIGDGAFGYNDMTSIIIPTNVTSLGVGAFEWCIYMTNITIPNGLTTIGAGAFQGSYSVPTFAIPSSVTNIGDAAFTEDSMTAITVDTNNPEYSSVAGVLFNKAQTRLIQYPTGNTQTSYVIPNGVTSIGDFSFENVDLTNLTIANTVSNIEVDAFYGSFLRNLVIPNGVTSIGAAAFVYSTSLTNITIGTGVTNLGNSAFFDCSSLQGVYFQGNAPGTNSSVFSGDSKLAAVYYLPGTTGWGNTFDGVVAIEMGVAYYTITVSASPGVGGTVAGSGAFASDSSQTVTATANYGYVFTNWTENGVVVSLSPSYTFTVKSNVTLIANFIGFVNGILYQTLDDPKAAYGVYSIGGTYAQGISGANVVGWYIDTNGSAHGFLYNDGAYTTLDDPKAVGNYTLSGLFNSGGTYATGISGTNIVGYYTDTNGVTHGFLFNGSTYTTLDDPNAGGPYSEFYYDVTGGTWVCGIEGNNIVGYYTDNSGNVHGFIYNGSTYTTLDDPNAIYAANGGDGTFTLGISGSNIVGYVDIIGVPYGSTQSILYNGSAYNSFYGTSANGISGGTIVGSSGNSGYATFGKFVTMDGIPYFAGNYTTVNVPNSATTSANGISSNTIVGSYTDGNGVSHGFTAIVINYTITVSTSPGTGGTVNGGGTFISGSSQTVTAAANYGYTFANWTENGNIVSSSASYNFTISSNVNLVATFTGVGTGTSYQMLNDPNGVGYTYALGIDGNNIVGSYENGYYNGFVYNGSNYTTLKVPLPGYPYTIVSGISGSNIVGWYTDGSDAHGFIYSNGSYTTIDDPNAVYNVAGNIGYYPPGGYGPILEDTEFDGYSGTFATGISGSKIVGWYVDGSGYNHGFLYNGGNYTTLDDPNGVGSTYAQGIDGKNIVGWYVDINGYTHGFLYNGSTYATLDNPNGVGSTFTLSISGGNILGYYVEANGFPQTFVYNSGTYTSLPTRDLYAIGIYGNTIVGYGFTDTVGNQQTGSLKMTILPTSAITAGAQWQADSGTWQNSGVTVTNLSVGNHMVGFSTINGWTTPSNQMVSVNANSTTTASSTYVAETNQLQIRIIGLGSISPNYSNAWLQIGQPYAITATPGTGFMFTNWTGGTNGTLVVLTNGPTVQFLMVSNLMLQATFLDTSKPTLSITNLVSGQRVSNAVFTVKGTSGDNWQVSNVLCQIDGGVWNSATNMNNWTNWSAGVMLVPGTNTVAAYAVDTSGNISTTNSVTFQFVVTNQLGVRAIGLGTILPNYSNAWLEIGRNYSITSAPASGFVFTNWMVSTNWLGGATVTSTNLQFMMQSNLTLQAGFVETNKPTLTITAPTSGQHMTNALATVTGTAGDVWGINAVWYQLTNGILTGGTWSMAATTNSYTNWSTTLTLAAGTNTVKAYAVNFGGIYSATNSMSFVSSNSFELQLAFTNAVPLKTNGLVFSLQLSAGLNGHIQVSTNLTSWATLTNFVGTNTTLTFRDPAATNFSRRFYRAVIP